MPPTGTIIGVTEGALDQTGALTFFLDLVVDADQEDAMITDTDGTLLTPKGNNNFVVDSQVLSYKSVNPTITFANETVPVTFVLPSATDGTNLITNIVGPLAVTTIQGAALEPDKSMIVSITLQLKGHLESGSGSFQSSPITFPLTIYTSNSMCTNGFQSTGVCGGGGGQDGAPVTCL